MITLCIIIYVIFHSELHNAQENKKALFPIIYEEITDDGSTNYNEFKLRMGRFNWLYNYKLDYHELLSKLIEGLNKGRNYMNCGVDNIV